MGSTRTNGTVGVGAEKFLERVKSGIILHYPAPPCTTLHHPALPCTNLHYAALPCTPLHSPALPCTTLHYPALPCTTLHYPALPYIALHQRSMFFPGSTRPTGRLALAPLARIPCVPHWTVRGRGGARDRGGGVRCFVSRDRGGGVRGRRGGGGGGGGEGEWCDVRRATENPDPQLY